MHQADPAWFPWVMPTGRKHVVIQFITWNETSGSMCACVRILGACAKILLLWFSQHVLNSVKEGEQGMFHFSSNIQQVRRSRHLHSRIHSLKKGQRFQAHFWRGGFLCFIGVFFVFFLNCLENPHCKEQATYFTPTTRRSKAFCFCHWNKDTLKTKIKRENSGVASPEPRWKTHGQKHADII